VREEERGVEEEEEEEECTDEEVREEVEGTDELNIFRSLSLRKLPQARKEKKAVRVENKSFLSSKSIQFTDFT
jgi:hypothetical protein